MKASLAKLRRLAGPTAVLAAGALGGMSAAGRSAAPPAAASAAAPGQPAPVLPVPQAAAATLIVTGARVWTGERRHPWAEAVAVRGERIEAVGAAAEIERLAGPGTRRIEARGGLVTPGLIDAHVHFLDGGFGLGSVALRDAATRAELVRRIAEFARTAPAGAWVLGGDWDHEQWGGELPRRDWIDAVTPDRPVWVNRLDGHMSLANSAALRAAGVTARTPDPPGGTIVRDPGGEPTGILKDNAMDLVDKVVPDPPPAAKDRALDAAMRYAAAQGVTSVHHMGTWEDLEVFRRAHDAGRLRTRISAAVPLATWQRLRDEVAAHGRGDEWLHIGGLKGFVDGSLGSRTAAFSAPYADAPANRGLLVNTPENLYGWTAGADRAGLQVIVHAIGDRAIHLQLDIFERVVREDAPATAASASSTPSTSLPPTSRGSRPSESSPACSPITPSTTDAGPKRPSGPSARRPPTPSARSSTPAPRWPSAATGPSHRRCRSWGSTPRSPAALSTTAIPTAGCRARRSLSRRPSPPIPAMRPTPALPSGTWVRSSPASSPTWCSSTAT
jgi:hypothetical protein